MKFLRGKRAVFPLVGAIVVVAVAFGFWQNSQPWIPEGWTAPLTPPPAHAQTGGSTVELKGWAWSSNIGWVSFNAEDSGSAVDYKVELNPTTGALTGYAWSNHIGWIQFDPAGAVAPGAAKMANGRLIGWARAIVGASPESAGWDGWISLSGATTNGKTYEVAYDSGTGDFDGYAWGSNVVGWLKFGLDLNNGSDCPEGVCVIPPPGGGGYACSPTPSGNNVTWSISPSPSASMRYQWNRDGNPISGATSATYTISNITPGTYNVNVTLTDGVTGAVSNTSLCPYTKVGTHTLTVNVVRNNGTVGTIISTPGTINCGTACGPVSFTDNTSITLSADADLTPGATMTCVGPAGSGINSCTFPMPAQNVTVTVTLDRATNDNFNLITTGCITTDTAHPGECVISLSDGTENNATSSTRAYISVDPATPLPAGEVVTLSGTIAGVPLSVEGLRDERLYFCITCGTGFIPLTGLTSTLSSLRILATIPGDHELPPDVTYYPITITGVNSSGHTETKNAWLRYVNQTGPFQLK